MSLTETQNKITPDQIRHQQIDKYWAGDLSRRVYLLRRQRKAILENCRRIAVRSGAICRYGKREFCCRRKASRAEPGNHSGFSDRESFLGLHCYRTLRDIPGKIDIVQVYPNESVDFIELARAAVDRSVSTFWIEQGVAASREVEDILAADRVQLVEYENLEREYLKHMPFVMPPAASGRHDKKAAKVKERMSRNPATVKPDDALKDAIWQMERGHFRHLPVIDENGKLIGILTDRDVRLIRPSLAFVDKEDAATQLWSIAVQQAAAFDPVSVKPETALKEAAEMMLRWHVGGLPVVDDHDKVVGMITYTDILREFIGRENNH